jgi:type III pantothenate kinase
MILAIDAGNTRIKWGLWEDRGFVAQGAVLTARAQELASALHTLALPAQAVGSNVAGAAVQAQIDNALAPSGVRPEWIRSRSTQCGVASSYSDPAQLGTDRWAALVGAHARFAEPCLVINVGTAVTVDALTAGGRFLGGLILPGFDLMAGALSAGTARLPLQPGRFELFPTSTANAIFSGEIQAVCGAIQRMERALAAADRSPVRIVLSGGGAQSVAEHLGCPLTLVPDLVLEGLIVIARA